MKNLTLIKKGSKGEVVKEWQTFLRGLKLYLGAVDGDFGTGTHSATLEFQKKYKMKEDGIVGSGTWSKAISLGFHLDIEDDKNPDPTIPNNANFPPKPDFPPLVSNDQRASLFGKIEYVASPTANNPEGIKITNGFESQNIVMVPLPQLSKATGGRYTGMRFHKLCANQLKGFFEEIEKEGLLHLIISYSGAYYPRFVRGSKTNLSNHSYGTAFDINVPQNGLNKTPALLGQKGCVRELVPIAHKWGFYWGGHFSRPDGMHFEVAKILG